VLTVGTPTATIVVDVCGTLVRDDTTLGLLGHHFAQSQRQPWRCHVLRLLTARMSPARWAFVVLEKMTGRHWLKHVLVRLLAGDSASELDASGATYAKELLSHQRVAPVWKFIGQAAFPEQVILASASLEPVVKALAQVMGARYVASTLEVRAGVLTGRYIKDLTGRKEEAITQKFGADVMQQPFAAISDNLSDRPLLAKACHACVVLHRESHRARWMNLPADYVKVTD
jgi:phosphoserine phosphatase